MYIVSAREFDAAEVESHGAQGVTIQWLLDESAGAPNFAMRRFTLEPGGHTPSHEHPWEHEVYILSGRGEVVLAGETVPCAADHAILVAPGEQHQFVNTGDGPLVFLCLVPNGPATEH